MGMVEGAVIGAVIGGIVALSTTLKNSRWQRAFSAHLREGKLDLARSLLFKHTKEVPRGAFPIRMLLPQRNRLAGLAVLGDSAALEQELGRHTGSAAYKAQVRQFNLLLLALRDTDPSARIAEIRSTADEVGKEANAMQKLLVNRAALLARVVGGLLGEPVDQADELALLKGSRDEPILVRIAYYRLLELCDERRGKPNDRYRTQLPELTTWQP